MYELLILRDYFFLTIVFQSVHILELVNTVQIMFLIILLVIALAIAIYKWATKNNDFFLKQGIPYLKPLFLIGSSGRFSGKKSPQESIIDHYNKFPESK